MELIAAVDKNWGIGKDGKLLAHLPGDMKFFRKATMNHMVIMGRKTFCSLPGQKPLQNRLNVVLTSNGKFRTDLQLEGRLLVARNIHELMDVISKNSERKPIVIGGGMIYEQLMPYCKTAHITYISADLCPDTFMPDLNKASDWILDQKSEWHYENNIHYQFLTYQNENLR